MHSVKTCMLLETPNTRRIIRHRTDTRVIKLRERTSVLVKQTNTVLSVGWVDGLTALAGE